MGRCRLEVDARRLLARCELMAAQQPAHNWRLVTYLQHLEHMLLELQRQPTRPSKDVIAEYNKRVQFLQGLVQSTRLVTTSQKVVAAQQLIHGMSITNSNPALKEIHQKTTEKYNEELKSELIGKDNEDVLRHRNIYKPPSSSLINGTTDDPDSMLEFHHNLQEKVAENMLILTRNLKEQSQLANQIIKKDTETLKTSSQLTETNATSLSTEHERLKEHNSRACKCWLWVIISLVLTTFISMVLLMKIFKKRIA